MSRFYWDRLDLERRHDRVVASVHEALRILQGSFAEGDQVPGVIQDAIDELERGIGRDTK